MVNTLQEVIEGTAYIASKVWALPLSLLNEIRIGGPKASDVSKSTCPIEALTLDRFPKPTDWRSFRPRLKQQWHGRDMRQKMVTCLYIDNHLALRLAENQYYEFS